MACVAWKLTQKVMEIFWLQKEKGNEQEQWKKNNSACKYNSTVLNVVGEVFHFSSKMSGYFSFLLVAAIFVLRVD